MLGLITVQAWQHSCCACMLVHMNLYKAISGKSPKIIMNQIKVSKKNVLQSPHCFGSSWDRKLQKLQDLVLVLCILVKWDTPRFLNFVCSTYNLVLVVTFLCSGSCVLSSVLGRQHKLNQLEVTKNIWQRS